MGLHESSCLVKTSTCYSDEFPFSLNLVLLLFWGVCSFILFKHKYWVIWVSVQLCSTHHFLHMCAAVKRKGNKLDGTDFHERCTQVNLQPVWINKRHTHAHTLSHLCFGHTCLPNELISIFVRCSVLQTVVWHHFFSWFSFLLAYIQPI